MVSEHKLHITARKGEYCLLDKEAGTHVSHTIFQLPSKMGKGVLVTPTVHGNLLVGPTAVDVTNKEAVNTTQDGLDSLAKTAALSVKNVPMRQVITSFAGLRAHEDGNDFIIGEAEDAKGFINAAGIESPGLSSAPAIGEMVAGIAADLLSLTKKNRFYLHKKRHLKTGDTFHGGAQSADQRASGIWQHHLPLRDDQRGRDHGRHSPSARCPLPRRSKTPHKSRHGALSGRFLLPRVPWRS